MIERVNAEETTYILSNAVLSANEGIQNHGTISGEKVIQMMTGLIEKGAYYLVYKENDSIAGWILVGTNTDYFTEKEIGFIYDVYVLSEFRGKGISKKLVQAGIEELKRNGYEEVRLNVFSTNFAQEIYEKIGFTPLQTVMVYK